MNDNLIDSNEIATLRAENARLLALINTPELHDFAKGVALEAAHQREKWGTEHDGGKSAADWFWLIGYLAQKAMMSQLAGDTDKALHHTVTTAAALANWHAAIAGTDTRMRPGIAVPEFDAALDAPGEVSDRPEGCGFQASSSQAFYLDLMCTDGRMSDMDADGDDPTEWRPPCPKCLPDEYHEWMNERIAEGGQN